MFMAKEFLRFSADPYDEVKYPYITKMGKPWHTLATTELQRWVFT